MSQKEHYFSPSTLRVCIDRMTDIEMAGRIFCKMQEEPIYFQNMTELLLKADCLFDRKGFPQAFHQKRVFGKAADPYSFGGLPELHLTDEQMIQQKGRCQTLEIMVNSRRYASWQGVIRNEEGVVCENFDGDIELIKYMQQKKGI